MPIGVALMPIGASPVGIPVTAMGICASPMGILTAAMGIIVAPMPIGEAPMPIGMPRHDKLWACGPPKQAKNIPYMKKIFDTQKMPPYIWISVFW